MGRPKTAKAPGPPEDIGLNWIGCEVCSGWELFENSGITGPYSDTLAKKANFVCRLCTLDGKLSELTLKLDKIASFLDPVQSGQSWSDVVLTKELTNTKDEMNKMLQDNCTSLKSEINLIKNNLGKTGSIIPPATLTAPQLRQATSELLDVESRKLSLVVSGLPEGLQDSVDFVNFCNTHHDLPNPVLLEDITSASRVGGRGPHYPHRLLKIKVNSESKKKTLLLMHKRRSSTAPAIYIRPDLTKAQLEIDKSLRDELRIKGKDQYKIAKGKIVPRYPPASAISSSAGAQCPVVTASTLPNSGPHGTASTKTKLSSSSQSLPYAGLPFNHKTNTAKSSTKASASSISTPPAAISLLPLTNAFSVLQALPTNANQICPDVGVTSLNLLNTLDISSSQQADITANIVDMLPTGLLATDSLIEASAIPLSILPAPTDLPTCTGLSSSTIGASPSALLEVESADSAKWSTVPLKSHKAKTPLMSSSKTV